MLSKLDGVIRAAKDSTAELNKVLSQTAHIQHLLEEAQLGQANQIQSNQILQVLGTARDLSLQKKILDAIAYKGMNQRYDDVEEPHLETFRWIIDEDVQEEDMERIAAKELFTDWLASGAGIFHLSGKLGSGKSTLMKFLHDKTRTRTLLQQWAGKKHLHFCGESVPLLTFPGSKKLIVSSFFFWKPGTELQRSLPGLIRSFLHAVLNVVPSLIPEVFPDAWNAIRVPPSGIQEDTLTASDISRGFVLLMKHTRTFESIDSASSSTAWTNTKAASRRTKGI